MDSQADSEVEARTLVNFLTSVKGIVKIVRLMSRQKDLSRDRKKEASQSRGSFRRPMRPFLESGLILIVIALILYILAQAPEPYIVITAFEAISVVFFIVLYILRLDLLLKCLFWPLLDIINSLMTIMCLLIVSVLAMVPETKVKVAIGGILGIVATVFTIADASLIYRKLMFNPSGPYEKKHSHDKKRRFRHSRHSRHSHHSHQSYQSHPPLEKSEDL